MNVNADAELERQEEESEEKIDGVNNTSTTPQFNISARRNLKKKPSSQPSHRIRETFIPYHKSDVLKKKSFDPKMASMPVYFENKGSTKYLLKEQERIQKKQIKYDSVVKAAISQPTFAVVSHNKTTF